MMLLGNKIMKTTETHRRKLPIISKRKPNHSFDAQLWKFILRFEFTLSRFP